MSRFWSMVLCSLPLAVLAGCQPASESAGTIPDSVQGPPWLSDVTDRVGLRFVQDPGPTRACPMPQIMGSGAALIDFDNDGRLDVYLLQNAGPGSGVRNQLWRQGTDGAFADVSRGSGLDIDGNNMGVAIGDVDNDGWPDVLVTQYGAIKLFLNNGNGSFRDVTAELDLRNPAWGTSAAFLDYDRDGWLDLVVVNYVEYDPTLHCSTQRGIPDYCHPAQFPGTVSRLFHNRGAEGGKWRGLSDVSLASGVGRLPGPGLGVIAADFDGDGWTDIFVANDGQPNRLWLNQKDGTFIDEAVARGVAYAAMGQAQANMGVALGDVDGDGLFDLFVSHLMEETHTLWVQGPRGLFQDRTAQFGLTRPRWQSTGFGAVLLDFDLDGALDLAMVNGHIARLKTPVDNLGPHWGWYGQRNQLFANDGQGRFHDISPNNPDFCGAPNVARGLARGDIDGDGQLDLLVTTVGGPARLLRDVAPRKGHWLAVHPSQPSPRNPSNARLDRPALGAEVTVRAGTKRWARVVVANDSYLCASDPTAHFGLGPVDRIEAIEVRWPDGSRETFDGGQADRRIIVRHGQGKAASTSRLP